MEPDWLYHGAKNEASFFIWLHGETRDEARNGARLASP